MGIQRIDAQASLRIPKRKQHCTKHLVKTNSGELDAPDRRDPPTRPCRLSRLCRARIPRNHGRPLQRQMCWAPAPLNPRRSLTSKPTSTRTRRPRRTSVSATATRSTPARRTSPLRAATLRQQLSPGARFPCDSPAGQLLPALTAAVATGGATLRPGQRLLTAWARMLSPDRSGYQHGLVPPVRGHDLARTTLIAFSQHSVLAAGSSVAGRHVARPW